MREGDGYAATSRADVDDARRRTLPVFVGDEQGQLLGFGAWYEYPRGNAYTQAVEVGVSQNVLDRFVFFEPFDDNFDFFSDRFVQKPIFVQECLHGRESAHLLLQQSGEGAYLFGRIEAVERFLDMSDCLLHEAKIAKAESRGGEKTKFSSLTMPRHLLSSEKKAKPGCRGKRKNGVGSRWRCRRYPFSTLATAGKEGRKSRIKAAHD